MAGRKQHYIPQFLLRGFSSAGTGKKLQVRVVTREKEFVVPTDGIAAQREFYSKLAEGSESLDSLITDAETEYADIYQSLVALNHGAQADSHAVARLLSHLAMRGSHLRDTFSLAGQQVLTEAVGMMLDRSKFEKLMGIAGDEPSTRFRDSLDKAYEKDKGKFAMIGVSRSDFRNLAFKYAKANSAKMYADFMPFMSMIMNIDTSDAAASGQKKALLDSLEPKIRVEAVSSIDWKVIDTFPQELVLPDSVAIGHIQDVGVVPVAYLSNEETIGVMFPLTTTRAVCGGIYTEDQLITTLLKDFQFFAAICSWNFIVVDPSIPVSPQVPRVMGSAVVSFLNGVIERGMQEVLEESMV